MLNLDQIYTCSQGQIDNKSALVQVMAGRRQAPSHNLSHLVLRSESPYSISRPLELSLAASTITVSQLNLYSILFTVQFDELRHMLYSYSFSVHKRNARDNVRDTARVYMGGFRGC